LKSKEYSGIAHFFNELLEKDAKKIKNQNTNPFPKIKHEFLFIKDDKLKSLKKFTKSY
jgi:hypothetical protein